MDLRTVSSFNVPVVLRNVLKWKICEWDFQMWKSFLANGEESKYFTFREGKICCSEEPFWEHQCEHIQMSLADFFDKLTSPEPSHYENWLYFDYKHIGEWFSSKAENLDISWGDFGHPEKTAKDSTLWIGSKGAHTPCHLDTYGCNLVAQLIGRKKWYLFPPSECDNLKPTRCPYEESSIYSSINFFCGCSDISSITNARMVILNPGDVLFVPHHWWHYVENLSASISINVWLPVPSDDAARLEESLVKYFVSSVCRSIDDTDVSDLLNPSEVDIPQIKESSNIKELVWCVEHVSDSVKNTGLEERDLPMDYSVPCISSEELRNILKANCCLQDNCLKKICDSKKDTIQVRKEIIKAFCHPDVISLVRQKLSNSLK